MTIQLNNLIKYVVEEPSTYERNKPYYILKADGVYRHTLRDAILVKELYSGLDRNLPLMKKGSEGFEYVLPKIPFSIYLTILDFYKAVYNQDRTEASCHVFYLGEDELVIPSEYSKYQVGVLQVGEWLVYCPQQTNTGTLTSFREDELYPYLRKHYRLAIETHSHHTMDAFWSGTDNANQKDAVLYGVFGKIGTKDDFLVKYVHDDENIKIESEVIIDYPTIVPTLSGGYTDIIAETLPTQVYKGCFNSRNEFPKEWLTDCHKVNYVKPFNNTQGLFGTEFEGEEDETTYPTESEGIAYGKNNSKEQQVTQPVEEGNRETRFFYPNQTSNKNEINTKQESNVGLNDGKTENKNLPTPRGRFYS